MRIFDVGNTARRGFWVAAPDAETAKDIALAAKHAKKRANLHVLDVTDSFLREDPEYHDVESIQAILNGTRTGRVVAIGTSFSGAEFFAALKNTGQPPKTPRTIWKVM